MTQHGLFDLAEGVRRKRAGKAKAANARSMILELAREIAHGIAADGDELTIDDVMGALEEYEVTPDQLGNAAGSVFKGKEWEYTGQIVPSVRASSHGRFVRVWRLRTIREKLPTKP
jgi:isocitrate dehydrogenase